MTAERKNSNLGVATDAVSNLKAQLYSPYVAMWLVVLMYCIKTVTKLGAGYVTNSPVFISDGYHNLADILQALAVMVVVYLARRPANAEYPLGKSNIEFFSSLAIGLSLLVLGVQFALQSLVGLLHYLPAADLAVRGYLPLPEHKPLLSDASTYPWLIGIMAISGALSWVVSRYQIAVGRATGHTSMVADGEETASDGRIELIALVGIISQPLFGAPWLEYPLALVVATMVLHTGQELVRQAFRALLQHSLSEEVEGEIRQVVSEVPGVGAVESLKSFQVGQVAVCLLTLRTTLGAEKVAFVRYGVELKLRKLLEDSGFASSEIHLKFVGSPLKRYRIAYALRQAGDGFYVAGTTGETTHVAICDVEDGHIARARIELKPADLQALLKEKLVGRVFFFGAAAEVTSSLPDITVAESTVVMPALLGIEAANLHSLAASFNPK